MFMYLDAHLELRLKHQAWEKALMDLWNSGVLEISYSFWNILLNPVPKSNGTFTMAHDLRRVDDVTTSPLLPVPDPHKCLSVLTPDMKFFSVIDMTQAFFLYTIG